MQKLKNKILELSTHHRDGNFQDGGDGASVIELLQDEVLSFPSVAEASAAFANRFEKFDKCKVLLIGDGSHGTSEFYAARAEITKYVIEKHGFNIVAIEADWPDAEAVDRYIRRRGGLGKQASVEPQNAATQADREPAFVRFPTWMWRNMEVHDFVEWLREHNRNLDVHDANSVGFYGLDLYSLRASMRAVINYLEQVDKDMADLARDRYSELMLWAEDPKEYGLEALVSAFKGYEAEVIQMLKDLLSKRIEYSAAVWNGVEFHSAEQNARVVKGSLLTYKNYLLPYQTADKHIFISLQMRNSTTKRCTMAAANRGTCGIHICLKLWSESLSTEVSLRKPLYGPIIAM